MAEPAAPPVTTLREGVRVLTSSGETAAPVAPAAPSVTPVARRVTSATPAATTRETSPSRSTAKVVTIDNETLDAGAETVPTPTASAPPAPQAPAPRDTQAASLDTDESLFGGPTGY